jgi:hypothetical protein
MTDDDLFPYRHEFHPPTVRRALFVAATIVAALGAALWLLIR